MSAFAGSVLNRTNMGRRLSRRRDSGWGGQTPRGCAPWPRQARPLAPISPSRRPSLHQPRHPTPTRPPMRHPIRPPPLPTTAGQAPRSPTVAALRSRPRSAAGAPPPPPPPPRWRGPPTPLRASLPTSQRPARSSREGENALSRLGGGRRSVQRSAVSCTVGRALQGTYLRLSKEGENSGEDAPSNYLLLRCIGIWQCLSVSAPNETWACSPRAARQGAVD